MKVKKPTDMTLDEIESEINANNQHITALTKRQENAEDPAEGHSIQMEINTLSRRNQKLSEQRISLLKHELAVLKKWQNGDKKMTDGKTQKDR